MLQAKVKASPPTSSLVLHVLLRVSQNRMVPSLAQLANSKSRTGLNSTFSIAWVWPFNSIWLFGAVLSGFQTRIVRSVEPVAIRVPVAFHDIVRWLCCGQYVPRSAQRSGFGRRRRRRRRRRIRHMRSRASDRRVKVTLRLQQPKHGGKSILWYVAPLHRHAHNSSSASSSPTKGMDVKSFVPGSSNGILNHQ